MCQRYGVMTADGVALAGLFSIDPDGVVQHSTINNLSVGRSVGRDGFRVLQACQFVAPTAKYAPPTGGRGEEHDQAERPMPRAFRPPAAPPPRVRESTQSAARKTCRS
jgi:peroxiredoxin (alkyl hydroperoxide reductase subunit C)